MIDIQQQHFQVFLLPQVLKVAFLNVIQVLVGDLLLVFTPSFPDIVLQPVCFDIQMHQQVRFGKVGIHDVEEPEKELVFVLVERFTGKDHTLIKKVIGDGKF